MTTTPTSGAADLPEALRLADIADDESWAFVVGVRKDIAAELRRLHTESEMRRTALLDEMQKAALAAGQATAAQAVVPAGWKLVPVDATDEMVRATDEVNFENGDTDGTLHNVWHVMIAAAPAQPAAQQGVAYAALPTHSHAGRVYEEGFLIGTCPLYTADQMRAFADATCALRTSHGQAPAWAADSFSEYGAVTTHSVTGQKFFYAAGAPPYLDNASECVTVYAKQKQPRPDDQGTPKDGWTDSSPTSCARGLGADQHHEHRARQSDRDGAHSECNSGCHGIHGPCDISQEVATPTAQAVQAAESVPAPPPPPECETEAEKRAFAFGWFKALESERMKADSVQEDAARESEYRRGYRHGYEQRDAEVRGAMA